MSYSPAIWPDPAHYIHSHQPDYPVYFFMPERLQETARRFQSGFPGLVTYAVKANDAPAVLENLVAAGIRCFDVASVVEMRAVRTALPEAVLHYNNPVRSRLEIRQAVGFGCRSWSVDSAPELEKLRQEGVQPGTEVAVRLKLPISGATYDFGEKFGVSPAGAAKLLRQVADYGYRPALCFHPGTQCHDPGAWVAYMVACAKITRSAGVQIHRLNVGGGFAARRGGAAPDLPAIFAAIGETAKAEFGGQMPELFCEPGRAMVADAFTLGTRVKAVRASGEVFLNDGLYGSFGESPSMGTVARLTVLDTDGRRKSGPFSPRRVFGPTCDSLDQLPEPVMLPDSIAEDDYVLFHGMGAYAAATQTGFNGYGNAKLITVEARGNTP